MFFVNYHNSKLEKIIIFHNCLEYWFLIGLDNVFQENPVHVVAGVGRNNKKPHIWCTSEAQISTSAQQNMYSQKQKAHWQNSAIGRKTHVGEVALRLESLKADVQLKVL